MVIPSALACASVAFEVATQVTFRPALTLGPKTSTNFAAVVPVPSPSFMPGSTYCSARSAAASFQASLLMMILPARCAPVGRGARFKLTPLGRTRR